MCPIIYAHGFVVLHFVLFWLYYHLHRIHVFYLLILFRFTLLGLGQLPRSQRSNLEGYEVKSFNSWSKHITTKHSKVRIMWIFLGCTVPSCYSMLTGWSSFLKISIPEGNFTSYQTRIIVIILQWDLWEFMFIYDLRPLNLETCMMQSWWENDWVITRCFITFMIACHIFSPFQVKLCSGKCYWTLLTIGLH